MKFRGRWAITPAMFLVIAGLVVVSIRHLLASPEVVWLTPKDGIGWLRVDAPFDLVAKHTKLTTAEFEATLTIPSKWSGGDLELSALRRGEISIDGLVIFDTGADLSAWKTTHVVALPKSLSPSAHRLRVNVSNENGPALVRVSCRWLQAGSWRSSADGFNWKSAIAVSEPFEPEIQDDFVSAQAAFARCWPLLFGLTGVGIFTLMRLPLQLAPRWGSMGRWVILLLSLVLGLRARTALPAKAGYDLSSHLDYIRYVAHNHRLPEIDRGWEFFQAPLYYIISGAFYAVLEHAGIGGDQIIHWLRVIPLACGILIVEIVYRTAKAAFPTRGDLQLLATAIGGFLPVNLYMAQLISNEPLAAVLSASGVMMMIQFVVQPQTCTPRRITILGLVTGLACLTKVTSLLWVLPIEISIWIPMRRNDHNWPQIVRSLLIFPLVVLLVSGGYFIHNHSTAGKWIVTNTQGDWWQDPGYRTPQMFTHFGHVLTGPAFTTARSVWDSLFGTLMGDGMLSGLMFVDHFKSPGDGPLSGMAFMENYLPYNYWLMACGLWLGLLPVGLMVVGAASCGFKSKVNVAALAISTLSVAIFVSAILYQYLTIPLYGWAKASYMLSAIPCLAILAAAGFDLLGQNRLLRAIIGGLLFTWAVTAYFTYWIA